MYGIQVGGAMYKELEANIEGNLGEVMYPMEVKKI